MQSTGYRRSLAGRGDPSTSRPPAAPLGMTGKAGAGDGPVGSMARGTNAGTDATADSVTAPTPPPGEASAARFLPEPCAPATAPPPAKPLASHPRSTPSPLHHRPGNRAQRDSPPSPAPMQPRPSPAEPLALATGAPPEALRPSPTARGSERSEIPPEPRALASAPFPRRTPGAPVTRPPSPGTGLRRGGGGPEGGPGPSRGAPRRTRAQGPWPEAGRVAGGGVFRWAEGVRWREVGVGSGGRSLVG